MSADESTLDPVRTADQRDVAPIRQANEGRGSGTVPRPSARTGDHPWSTGRGSACAVSGYQLRSVVIGRCPEVCDEPQVVVLAVAQAAG